MKVTQWELRRGVRGYLNRASKISLQLIELRDSPQSITHRILLSSEICSISKEPSSRNNFLRFNVQVERNHDRPKKSWDDA
jgi:hypothetical protein